VGPRAGTEEHMQEQINRLSNEVATLTTTQRLNHDQNRKDIHDLRNGQQKVANELYLGFEKMTDLLEKTLTPIKQQIFDLQMWKSKTTGYVLGISAVSALVFALVEKFISVALK
jgi:hypothetical protein